MRVHNGWDARRLVEADSNIDCAIRWLQVNKLSESIVEAALFTMECWGVLKIIYKVPLLCNSPYK